LPFAHPCLPFGVGVHVRAVFVEEVALNSAWTGWFRKANSSVQKIRVIAFHVGVAPDVARPRCGQRQQIGSKRTFVGGAIGPKGPPRLPIRPQTFVVRNGVLND
jgi:hypothetical protein